MNVEPANDAPLIQFDQEERSGPRTSGNDSLVITALLANYEIERVFIDSGNSIDILFGEAYDQMQLGRCPPRGSRTFLYGFAGEVVHPRGMISVPLTLGTSPLRKTCLLKFLVEWVRPRPMHCKHANATLRLSKEERKEDWRKHRGRKTPTNEGRIRYLGQNQKRNPLSWKVTKIGSKMKEDARNQVVNCLRKNRDIFAWTPQDLEGIEPGVITHHFNLDPTIRPVKQKKRHFGPEKDKIIQREVNKLLTAGYIKKIQFLEWLFNVVLVPKPGGKWRMCIYFRDLNKACPKDFYPLSRIDQLVNSTSGCELLSMMDTSQGYHQIMLAPEDHKMESFITSDGTFSYVAMPFGLKNAGATYQRLMDKIF
ncbi:UNVERIFIED_CONTAM: Pro-Pol polyprotein [Sesamum latifolium]|uniref:Pro-Pol polyprotein n=1 Tax=Sesamum latifolium TaxID=2727402 RepID=A0AAW2TV99_9LAMI